MSSLATILVEVLIRVTELVTIEANASGRRYFEALIPFFLAKPSTTGRKNAVAAVLLMNAERVATETRMVGSSR